VVLTSREDIIGREAHGKGLMGMSLRYLYEMHNAAEHSMISST
jgi:hypothetical protein